jgi:hypothetical protein
VSSLFLLLSGSAGPPTTLADEGRRHLLIDASQPRPPHSAVLASFQSSIGRILCELGGDAPDPQAWAGIPAVAQLSAIQQMLDGLADPQLDRIVIDCASVDQARGLVETPSALLRLLDSALTPRLAMWRFPGEGESDSTVFEALSAARNHLQRMQTVLRHDETVMRIVAEDSRDDEQCRDAASMFGVLGVASEVWLSGERIVQVAPLVVDGDRVDASGGEFRLNLTLSGSAAARSRVGRRGDDLVVEFDHVHRYLPLPPVLLRCHAVDAERTADGLRVRFAPDRAQWRQPAESPA